MDQKRGFFSCLSAALLFFFIIFQMTLFGTISGNLLTAFQLGSATLGALSSLYFYAAAFTLIPFGLLLDYGTTRKPTLLVVSLLVAATFLLAAKPSLITVALYRIICGLSNSLIFLVCMRQAPMWYSKHLGLAISLIITIGMVGGLVQTPFSMLLNCFGWEGALYFNSFLGAVILAMALLALKDNSSYQPASFNTSYSKYKELWIHFKASLANKENWLCGFFAGLLNLPVMVLGATWGIYYIIHAYGLSNEQAAIINSMIFLGMIFASPLIGWFSDFMKSRKIPMLIGSVLSVAASLGLFYAGYHFSALIILFFVIGFTCTGQILSYSVVTESNDSTNVSTSMSFVSIILYLIGAFANPLFGWLIEVGERQNIGFFAAVGLFVISFVIAVISAILVKESYKK